MLYASVQEAFYKMIDEYLKARKAGEKEYKARLAAGEYPFLPALDDILPDNNVMNQRRVGLIEIPVRQIAGTKTRARQNSFAPDFMPLLGPDTEFAIKWSNLYQAQMDEGFNSPIKVYEYLHRFYVQEGNKRVSVSRFLDMPAIMADVTRIIPTAEVMAENPVYGEFLEFYEAAGIYDIECTLPGSYREIAKLLGYSIGGKGSTEKWPEDVVRSLKSSYWRFSETVHALQDKVPDMPLGDAYLVYLRIYVRDALNTQPDKELDKRVRKIRKELLTVYKSFSNDNVALVESSDEALNAGGLITKTGGLITRPGSLIGKVIPQISYSEKHPLKAAFIYDRLPEDSDWIYNHDAGRRILQESYGELVQTKSFIGLLMPKDTEKEAYSAYKEVYEGTEAAIKAAAVWGADVVFTVSPRQINDALRAAIEYENIIFLNCSVNLAHQAVRTYYAKLYETKFLAGVVAAVEAGREGSHVIGYCSDYPIYGTIASINAFAIGAAMIDPDIRIRLEWTTRQDNDWWRLMHEEGISVISAFDSTHRVDGSNVYGVFKFETDPETGEERIRNLAAPIWKWGKLYEIIVKTILEGTYHASPVDRKDQATNYWWGMISGAVDIKLSDSLSPYTRQLVELLKEDIISGRMNPFDGELKSQTGWIRRLQDPPLTSKDVITMNWLNENIIGEIPETAALNEEARETVSISGVK